MEKVGNTFKNHVDHLRGLVNQHYEDMVKVKNDQVEQVLMFRKEITASFQGLQTTFNSMNKGLEEEKVFLKSHYHELMRLD